MCFPSRPSGLTNSHTHRRINSHTHSYVCKCTFNRTQTDINTQYALKHTVLFLINLLHNYKMFKENCKHLTLSTGRKHFFCFTMCMLKLMKEFSKEWVFIILTCFGPLLLLVYFRILWVLLFSSLPLPSPVHHSACLSQPLSLSFAFVFLFRYVLECIVFCK